MITLRRAEERHHDRCREQEAWLTFYPQDREETEILLLDLGDQRPSSPTNGGFP